jgi:hypothetical protein
MASSFRTRQLIMNGTGPEPKLGGGRRERKPNRLLSSCGRRESPVGVLWFDGQAQVFAIPGGERLGIARFEESIPG